MTTVQDPGHDHVLLVISPAVSDRHMDGLDEAQMNLWRGLAQHAQDAVQGRGGGRLIRVCDEGLLAAFDSAPVALRAAFQLHRGLDSANRSHAPHERLRLRAGMHATQVLLDEHPSDHAVTVAAQVAHLAEPGATLVTEAARDTLVEGLDANLKDMGESYLKHWYAPTRLWLANEPTGATRKPLHVAPTPVTDPTSGSVPSIAVLPFECPQTSAVHAVVGYLIADGVIAQLSRCTGVRVISRHSSERLRNRDDTIPIAGQLFRTRFVLSGRCAVHAEKLFIAAELWDTTAETVVWTDRLSTPLGDLLHPGSETISRLAAGCATHLIHRAPPSTRHPALPRLDSNAQLMSAIALMHRSARHDLDRSLSLLFELTQRHPDLISPKVWQAEWHLVRTLRGQAEPAIDHVRCAIDFADCVLDSDPDHAQALASKGHALSIQGRDFPQARRLLEKATYANPNNPRVWLYRSMWSAQWGDAGQALQEAEQALRLSPIDPLRPYIDLMLANGCLGQNQPERAMALCRASLRLNSAHVPTLRTLITSAFEAGKTEECRSAFDLLTRLQPGLTLESYLAIGGKSPLRVRGARALEAMGLKRC